MSREWKGLADRYRVDETMVRYGGQARVVLGWTTNGERVAIKVPRGPLSGEVLSGFEREWTVPRKIAARQSGVSDWLIVPRDRGTTRDGEPFLVFPWYEDTLTSWKDRGHRSMETLLLASERAARAVHQLHQASTEHEPDRLTTHNDIKEDNFHVREDASGPSVLLGDLGSLIEGELFQPNPTVNITTVFYSPPECTVPLRRPPDSGADVYSLSVMIFRMITGQGPRTTENYNVWLEFRRELCTLHLLGDRRSADQQRRYEALRGRRVDDILRDEEYSFFGSDRRDTHDSRLVRNTIADDLRGRVGNPERLALEVVQVLSPIFVEGLRQCPEARLKSADTVANRCARARALIERELRERGAIESCPSNQGMASPVSMEGVPAQSPRETALPQERKTQRRSEGRQPSAATNFWVLLVVVMGSALLILVLLLTAVAVSKSSRVEVAAQPDPQALSTLQQGLATAESGSGQGEMVVPTPAEDNAEEAEVIGTTEESTPSEPPAPAVPVGTRDGSTSGSNGESRGTGGGRASKGLCGSGVRTYGSCPEPKVRMQFSYHEDLSALLSLKGVGVILDRPGFVDVGTGRWPLEVSTTKGRCTFTLVVLENDPGRLDIRMESARGRISNSVAGLASGAEYELKLDRGCDLKP